MKSIEKQLGLGYSSADAKSEPTLDKVATDVVTLGEDTAKEAMKLAEETYDVAKPEVEAAVGGVKQSVANLDAKKQVVSGVPNSVWVFGLGLIGVYLLFRK
jgi:hypothetical protein